MIASLAEAKEHLRVTGTARDSDITAKLQAAEAIILDYLKNSNYQGSTHIVKAAVLIQLGELDRFRGDDEQAPPQTPGQLSPVITNLLMRLRDPAIA